MYGGTEWMQLAFGKTQSTEPFLKLVTYQWRFAGRQGWRGRCAEGKPVRETRQIDPVSKFMTLAGSRLLGTTYPTSGR